MTKLTRKHWTIKDFVITHTSPAYDGSDALNKYGYCRICKGDMQSFAVAGEDGYPRHYASHKNAKRAGIV